MEVEADAGTIVARARSGASGLVRTAGRTSLARAPGGISLVRTFLRAMLGFLRCRHHQEGTMTTIRTRGLCDTQNFIWIFQKKIIWLEGGDLNFSSKEPSLSKYFFMARGFYLDSPKTCFWSWRFLFFYFGLKPKCFSLEKNVF